MQAWTECLEFKSNITGTMLIQAHKGKGPPGKAILNKIAEINPNDNAKKVLRIIFHELLINLSFS